MALKFNLPGGVSVYREISSSLKKKPEVKPAPLVEPACSMPDPKPASQKSLLENAVEAVDEVIRPKSKRNQKPKSSTSN